jgi:hypothetical protein
VPGIKSEESRKDLIAMTSIFRDDNLRQKIENEGGWITFGKSFRFWISFK